MTYIVTGNNILQQQIDFTSGTTKINRVTNWCSPTASNQIYDNRIDSIEPLIPTNHNDVLGSQSYLTWMINKKYQEQESIWSTTGNNNVTAIHDATDNKYAGLLSPNINKSTKTYNTPYISCNGFNFNIPTGATITGIQVKITRSSTGMSDIGTISPNTQDEWLFNNRLNHYTYDRLVTLTMNTSYTNAYENKAKYYESEKFNPTTNYVVGVGGLKVKPPVGVWGSNKESVLYGNQYDLWYEPTSQSWSVDDLNSSNFTVVFGAVQHIFRGQDTTMSYNTTTGLPIFPTNWILSQKVSWYYQRYITDNYNTHQMCYEKSKIFDIQVRVFYDIKTTGYIMYDRDKNFSSGNTLLTDDIYFKYQKCFDGICYSYIKDIKDIYKTSLLTGDGKSINNMYNEYNVIDEYLKNIYIADIATKENVDLSINHYTIDNIKLIPNHLVLLLKQTSAETNDIYRVNNNYFLENSNLLSTRESSDRAKVYVKMGTHNQKQYFLLNSGNKFPIVGEYKTFVSGHSYIVKNQIDYNIFNTSSSYTYSNEQSFSFNHNELLYTGTTFYFGYTISIKVNNINTTSTQFVTQYNTNDVLTWLNNLNYNTFTYYLNVDNDIYTVHDLNNEYTDFIINIITN